MTASHPITEYLRSLSAKELIDNDFNVKTMSEQIYYDFHGELDYNEEQILAHKILFLQQTSGIIFEAEGKSVQDIDERFIQALYREVYQSVSHAKMLRCALSKKAIADLSLMDILNNYDALSDAENEFEIEAHSAQERHLPIFNRHQMVKDSEYTVLCANSNSAEQIMEAENYQIDPRSKDPAQTELNEIRLNLSDHEHFQIFGMVKAHRGPFHLEPRFIERFFHSHRGALTDKQWDQIYQALSPELRAHYFETSYASYQLKGLTERQFLDELVARKISVNLTPTRWQRRKLLNQLNLTQLLHYAEMIFNVQITDSSSMSRAKVEMAHKFGFNASAIFKVISTALSLGLDHLGTIAQAKLMFGLYGLHGEVMKGHQANQQNRKKFLERCIKVNRGQMEKIELEADITDLRRTLDWGRSELTQEIKEMVARAGYQYWLTGVNENKDSLSHLQTVIDIILSRRRELMEAKQKGGEDVQILASFADYLHKHRNKASGLYSVADQSFQEAVKLSGIAGFLAQAYKTVTPQLAITLNMLDFVFKAIVMTIAISALLALVVPETTPLLVLTGISVGLSTLLSVNKYYRMRNEANTNRILEEEKNEKVALRVDVENINREKYALKFFVRTMNGDQPGGDRLMLSEVKHKIMK